MKALITGAAGFIGSNLYQRCLDEGFDVWGVDNLCNGQLKFLPKKAPHALIIRDFSSDVVLGKIKNQEFDVVFHIAALPRVSYSIEHPIETNDVNVTKTLHLMDACRGNIKRFVFASSSSVYGGAEQLPTPETAPLNPQSPYAFQKLAIEQYLKLWSKHYGMDSACLRFFNVFGKHSLGGSPYSTAVSAWLTAIKNNKPMRSDGDGSQSRDLCHVDNVVDCLVRAAKHSENLSAEAFNVACGDRTTNKEILDYLMKRYPSAQKVDAPWRAGDVMHTQADITKAKNVLGYVPIVRVWDGVDRTIQWAEKTGMLTMIKSSM